MYKIGKFIINFHDFFLDIDFHIQILLIYHMQKSWECINSYAIMTLVINLHVF